MHALLQLQTRQYFVIMYVTIDDTVLSMVLRMHKVMSYHLQCTIYVCLCVLTLYLV